MPGNLQDIPASVILTWPPPNYEHPNPQRTWIGPWVGVLQSVMTLMVGTRLWLRATQKAGKLGLDDVLLVPAFLSATMFSVVVIMSNRDYGTDRHIWLSGPSNMLHDCADTHLGTYRPSAKISVLLFYRRLVQGTFSKRWRMATISAIVFTACYCVAIVLALIFNCNPTNAYWKAYSLSYTKSYTCANTKSLNPLAGTLSVFSDLYTVVLPMGMLRHFEASKRQKLALNAVFSLGLIIVAAGCVRTYYIYQLGVDYDITWMGYHLIIWSSLELHMALICASAPSLRVFFREYMSDPLSRMMHSTRSLTSTRDASRLSRHTNSGEIFTHSSRARDNSIDSSNFGDRKLTQHNVKPSLETGSEAEVETSSPYTRARHPAMESRPIKTPADFEAFALQNLEKHRPPPRAAFTRQASDTFPQPPSAYSTQDDPHSHLEQPFTDWYSPPRSGG
ncbi:hypothetical protein LTR02_016883 [Friedmanniomyces endolithicus]|nr:hypothetical protein LTR02_016883 [Friedmanniomyces endolithicus]